MVYLQHKLLCKTSAITVHILCTPVNSVPVINVIRSHLHSSGLIVQELCESRGGHPGQSVLTSLLVSVDVKNY